MEQNDGETPYAVTANDVTVDAFWSITVYNADGYMEAPATTNGVNCIPITPNWNYAIRLYRPREEILDGSWTFPAIEPASYD